MLVILYVVLVLIIWYFIRKQYPVVFGNKSRRKRIVQILGFLIIMLSVCCIYIGRNP